MAVFDVAVYCRSLRRRIQVSAFAIAAASCAARGVVAVLERLASPQSHGIARREGIDNSIVNLASVTAALRAAPTLRVSPWCVAPPCMITHIILKHTSEAFKHRKTQNNTEEPKGKHRRTTEEPQKTHRKTSEKPQTNYRKSQERHICCCCCP